MVMNILGECLPTRSVLYLTPPAVGHGLGDHIEAVLARGNQIQLMYRVCLLYRKVAAC